MKLIINVINIFLFLLGIFYFLISILIINLFLKLGFKRSSLIKLTLPFFWLIHLIFYKRINYDSNSLLNQQVNLVNSNHYHNFDWIILFIFFYNNNVREEEITSISLFDKSFYLENLVFEAFESILIDNKGLSFNFDKKIIKYKNSKYKRYIICFFEGISLNHYYKNDKLVLEPKLIIYQKLKKVLYNYKFNDLTLVYLYKNKLLNPKDKYFILKYLSPDCKIKIINNICKFNDNTKLNEMYQNKELLLKTYNY